MPDSVFSVMPDMCPDVSYAVKVSCLAVSGLSAMEGLVHFDPCLRGTSAR